MNCKNCQDELDPRRVELGYDYCTEPECQDRHLRRVTLASVAVNKASDQYVRAEDVLPRGPEARWRIDDDVASRGEGGTRSATPRAASPAPPRRRPSTAQRLRAAERRLDEDLAASYERFCRGELTFVEMRKEQNERIQVFNALVRSENIRFRRFLRDPV